MSLTPLPGILGMKKAAFLLQKATSGASKEQIEQFSSLTAKEAVARLFPEFPDSPFTDSSASLWSVDDNLRQCAAGCFEGEMKNLDQLGQDLTFSLQEKIILFFENLFDSKDLSLEKSLLRAFAFDREDRRVLVLNKQTGMMDFVPVPTNFKTLTKKIFSGNLVLIGPTGKLNRKNHGKDNVIDVISDLFSFSEEELSKSSQGLNFVSDEQFHWKAKTAGAVTSRNQMVEYVDSSDSLITNTGTNDELNEVSKILDTVYSRKEIATYVCQKMYDFFIADDVDAKAGESILPGLVNTFTSHDFRLQPVLEELFQSKLFYAAVSESANKEFLLANISSIWSLQKGHSLYHFLRLEKTKQLITMH